MCRTGAPRHGCSGNEAREAYAPSMARRDELAVERLYRRALRGLPVLLDGTPPQALPETAGFTLAELLAPEPEEGT